MSRTELKNVKLPEPRGYSRAVSATGSTLVFTSMTAPIDEAGNVVGPDDAELQAKRVMANLREILEVNGRSFDDVVKVSAYVTRQQDVASVMRVMGESFSPPLPAIALAVVVGLPNPAFLVEIEAVAVVP